MSADGGKSGYSLWDPLKYENYTEFEDIEQCWGEYSEDSVPVYTLFDSYEDYQAFLDGDIAAIRSIPPLWKMAKEYAKKILMGKMSTEENVILRDGELSFLLKGFDDIFKKYGLWYTFHESWQLAGYRTSK